METSDINELRAEIDRLSRELDQASSEKIQSAKYGLGLLEEKSLLQQKCEELETLYENANHDLEITKEVRCNAALTQTHTHTVYEKIICSLFSLLFSSFNGELLNEQNIV